VDIRIGLVTAGLVTALAPAMASAATADDLIARHVQARGGAEALKAINSVRMTGKLRPDGFAGEISYVETISRPGSIRIDSTLQGLTIVQAYDGRTGWQIQPFQGRKDPEKLSDDDLKSLTEEADFEGSLVDYKAKGNAVQYLGEEEIDGAPAYAIRVSLKNGDQQTYYLDPDAMLTIRIETTQVVRGAEQRSVADYGAYEKVAGVYFPYEVASGPKTSTQRQRISYDTVEANVAVDASTFAQPGGAPAPAAAR
jgi:outer membrane lipoprotein-sorting protein